MKEPKRKPKIIPSLVVSLIVGIISYYLTKNWINSLTSIIVAFLIFASYLFTQQKLEKSKRIKKMEEVFPDFLQLVASNLKAGITVDKSLLISSRKEFAPLDQEINQMGRDIITGKQIGLAMRDMSKRINSEKIKKTTDLIISGMKSGGDIATLLEQTATNIRERDFIQKKSASNVLMYIIFIFFAITIGSPALFALSTVLVEVMKQILTNIPAVETSFSLPFSLTEINISTTFITYFAVFFIMTTVVLGSLIMGLVRKGKEKEGIKYMIPMLIVSLSIYFIIKTLLSNYFADFLG